jgi:peptidoglycan/xylan/chitin deacetylase (PgdA/CDA1 family)
MDEYILRTIESFAGWGVESTFFVPATVLEDNQNVVDDVLAGGHQIASHGLHHNDEPFENYPAERYDLLDEKDQIRVLDEGTDRIAQVLGFRPTAFRSPCFGISGTTLRLLEERGFRAECSVNSQRLDLLTASPWHFRNLRAPRLPYHPDFYDPFKKGDSKIWEIPVSAFIVPFAVMTLITFPMSITKAFFKGLYREARRTGKPIVYVVHPEEFVADASTYTLSMKDMGFKDFLPIRGRGIRARQAMRMSDPKQIKAASDELFDYMRSFDDIEFTSVDRYVDEWLEGDSESSSAA